MYVPIVVWENELDMVKTRSSLARLARFDEGYMPVERAARRELGFSICKAAPLILFEEQGSIIDLFVVGVRSEHADVTLLIDAECRLCVNF